MPPTTCKTAQGQPGRQGLQARQGVQGTLGSTSRRKCSTTAGLWQAARVYQPNNNQAMPHLNNHEHESQAERSDQLALNLPQQGREGWAGTVSEQRSPAPAAKVAQHKSKAACGARAASDANSVVHKREGPGLQGRTCRNCCPQPPAHPPASLPYPLVRDALLLTGPSGQLAHTDIAWKGGCSAAGRGRACGQAAARLRRRRQSQAHRGGGRSPTATPRGVTHGVDMRRRRRCGTAVAGIAAGWPAPLPQHCGSAPDPSWRAGRRPGCACSERAPTSTRCWLPAGHRRAQQRPGNQITAAASDRASKRAASAPAGSAAAGPRRGRFAAGALQCLPGSVQCAQQCAENPPGCRSKCGP